ncbi:monocarboxylate transporter 12-like isoform X2 [Lasioglossum baleicum]|uniref:monocarboxylate transporter 12-like isoform X2 n=1 Tax=Lasioglossum baleicum TaxID=434251 RepID=UPI003FCD2590
MAHAAVGSSTETNKRGKKSTSENVACERMDHTTKSTTAQHPLPPDGGWGYIVILASFLIHVITDGITYSFGVFYLEFLYYFEGGKGATAWVASILVGVTLCSGPISGSLVNKFGCRAVTIAGSILASSCLLASMWARNIITLYFTIGIGAGFGFGLIYLPAIVSVSCYFEKYRSLATGIAVCGSGLGTLVFAPCLEYLISSYGWRGTIMICSGIVLNCIVLGALFRPIKEKKSRKRGSPENISRVNNVKENSGTHEVAFQKESNSVRVISTISQPALILKDGLREESLGNVQNEIPNLTEKYSEEKNHIRGSLQNLPNSMEHAKSDGKIPNGNCEDNTVNFNKILDISILKDPVFILFTFSNFCTSIGFNVPYVYVLPQAEEQGIAKNDASYLLAIIGIANTVGRIVLGYISDKPWVNRLLIYNLCLTICGLGCLYDELKSYDPGFYTAGAMITVSGLILFFIPLIQKKVRRNVNHKKKKNITNNEFA